jgi:hypothetical protein
MTARAERGHFTTPVVMPEAQMDSVMEPAQSEVWD